MKPELTIQDTSGIHNKDLNVTRSRLVKGGSWKKQRVVFILPADTMIPAKVALSHWNLVSPPNQGICRILAQGMEVGDAYSTVIEQILTHPQLGEFEYILTLEHDNMPPSDGLINLLEKMETHPEYSCIGGLYFTKGEGGVAQIWGDVTDPTFNCRPQLPDVNGGLVECHGTGMGFNLWRLPMFRDTRLRKPWFRTVADKNGAGTQDLYFWADARKYGYRCAVDCSVRVGHYSYEQDICW